MGLSAIILIQGSIYIWAMNDQWDFKSDLRRNGLRKMLGYLLFVFDILDQYFVEFFYYSVAYPFNAVNLMKFSLSYLHTAMYTDGLP